MGSRSVTYRSGVEEVTYTDFTRHMSEYAGEDEEWWTKESYLLHRELKPTLFLEAMASCTEITYVNESLVGDPLDVKMFQATGWLLDEPQSK